MKRTVTLVEYAIRRDVEVTEPELAEELDSIIAAYPESERDRIREAYRSDDMKNRLEGRLRDRKSLDALIAAIEVSEAEPEQTDSGIVVAGESEAGSGAAGSDVIIESV